MGIRRGYQFPNLVMLAEGNISTKPAGTFPEKDGRTVTRKSKEVSVKYKGLQAKCHDKLSSLEHFQNQ